MFKSPEAGPPVQQNDREKQKIKLTIEAQGVYGDELEMASQGTWRPSSSEFKGGYFINKSGNKLHGLQGYFDELMARTLKALDYQFQQEANQVNSGTWDKDSSSFRRTKQAIADDEIEKYIFIKFRELLNPASTEYKEETESAGQQEYEGPPPLPPSEINIILGLPHDATGAEVIKAYRKFMMQNHPDRNQDGLDKETKDKIGRLTNLWSNR